MVAREAGGFPRQTVARAPQSDRRPSVLDLKTSDSAHSQAEAAAQALRAELKETRSSARDQDWFGVWGLGFGA